ncbi:energy transducer TonB, partial [Pararhodospirillum oryzae]|uniref:energy transducer TonB n=1 Tax=Pararhodospirillum oryzae TaxID=478448 RepID=UPI001FE9CDEC
PPPDPPPEPEPEPPPPEPAPPPPVPRPVVRERPRPPVVPRPARVSAPAAPAAPAVEAPRAEVPRAPQRAPAVIQCRTPAYPAASRRAGERGVVLLALLIDPEGRVIDHRVERSSGFPRLDEAAVKALSQCRFEPGTVDGRREPTWAHLRYVWKLED